MKTKELEEMLDIPRSAIRFYEKQGLISPKRSEHSEEREYSTEDAERLQKIVLLRKLGFSVTVIKDLLDHRIDLQEQITQQIELLQKQQEELDGVLYRIPISHWTRSIPMHISMPFMTKKNRDIHSSIFFRQRRSLRHPESNILPDTVPVHRISSIIPCRNSRSNCRATGTGIVCCILHCLRLQRS